MSGLDGAGRANSPRLGSLFGRYRIESVLGRGGMGVVLLATDTELQRPVALKFLAAELATDPVFRERFVRESRLAAAIEHPAIVPIYEAGAVDDALFIAMRYVPGADLGAILRTDGPLTVQRSLAIATPLADALDAAHRRGLVHRDVKPGNVLVEDDEDERVYLTDFGLTRRSGDVVPWSTAGPLGTLDYMAPEQIERGPVDGRTDQYSLACLIFHCLSGEPPFRGVTEAALLYAHVHSTPPMLSERRPELGTAFDAPLMRALAKDPAARFPDCRSLVSVLREAASGKPAAVAPRAAKGTGRRPTVRRPILLGIAALIVLAAVAALASLSPGGGSGAAPSQVAVASDRPLDSGEAGSVGPVASTLARKELIVFASNKDGDYDLYRVDPDGSSLSPMTDTRRNETSPALSPDGRTIAFVVGWLGARDLWLMNADTTSKRQLTFDSADDYGPRWSPDGKRLAFSSTRTGNEDIYVMTDDGSGLSEAHMVDVTNRPAFDQYPDWSSDGSRLAFSTNYWGGRDIETIDPAHPAAAVRQLTSGPEYDWQPAWSPDGVHVAFASGPENGPFHAYSMTVAGTAVHRLTSGPQEELQPDYSPDGSRVVYASGPTDATELLTGPADGGQPTPLTKGMSNAIDPDWGVVAVP